MLRFIYMVIINLFRLPYYCHKMKKNGRNPNRTELENFIYIKKVLNIMNRTGRIKPVVHGLENLPKDQGYFIMPNHQGLYDTQTIITMIDRPIAFLIEMKKSKQILTNSFTILINSKRLDLNDLRQQAKIYKEMALEVSNGRSFVVYPEGQHKYTNDNVVHEFHTGCMGMAYKAMAPIVPTALVDSYKTFTKNTLKTARPEIYFLEPLYYEDYKDLKKEELAYKLQTLISNKVNQVLNERKEAIK